MGKGKKDRIASRKQDMHQKQQERREDNEEKRGAAKQRRKKQYNRAEDKGWAAAFDKFSIQIRAWNLQPVTETVSSDRCPINYTIAQSVRQDIVQYIEDHRELFEPFIEDDEPFDNYCKSMRKNARWGGNLEIQAGSMRYNVNIHIYQLDRPRWDVMNFPPQHRFLSLSYHDGEHYNSVRALPPAAIAAAAAAARNAPSPREEKYVKEYQKQKEDPKKDKLKPTEAEKKVIKATGCQDIKMIRDMLAENGGDIGMTINTLSFLITTDSKTTSAPVQGDDQIPSVPCPPAFLANVISDDVLLAISQADSLELAASNIPAAAMTPSQLTAQNTTLFSASSPSLSSFVSTSSAPLTSLPVVAIPAASTALPMEPPTEESKDENEEKSDEGDEQTEEEKEATRRARRLEKVRGGVHQSNAARKAQVAREKEAEKRTRKNLKVAKKAAVANGEIPPTTPEAASGPVAGVAPVALTTMRI